MYHTIIVVGNLGKDPEMRFMPDGKPVTSFSVADSRKYNNAAGQEIQEIIWFRVSAFGKTAEACNQYLKKGSKVLIEGRLTPDKATGGPRIWTKTDGGSGASFEINASTVRFLSSKGEGAPAAAGGGQVQPGPAATIGVGGGDQGGFEMSELPPEDDIPF